jgi:hypothetical protein
VTAAKSSSSAKADETKDHYDDEDVKAALEHETQDGSGFESEDELPKSDFDGDADEYEGDLGETPEDDK